jgi:GNAT superfamily N-acetyltransferase
MQLNIRLAQETDLDALQELTVLAFEPVRQSFSKILGSQIFPLVYPDWRQLHRDHVSTFYREDKSNLYVADDEGILKGLMSYCLDEDKKQGEIEFLAVHPDYQNYGIGTHLNNFALAKMREAGMQLAIVGTGGDESHAPARQAYEKAGFVPLPNVWYVQKLD